MKNCGACGFLGASEAPDEEGIAEELGDITGSDGWGKFFDKESRSCSIHDMPLLPTLTAAREEVSRAVDSGVGSHKQNRTPAG